MFSQEVDFRSSFAINSQLETSQKEKMVPSEILERDSWAVLSGQGMAFLNSLKKVSCRQNHVAVGMAQFSMKNQIKTHGLVWPSHCGV